MKTIIILMLLLCPVVGMAAGGVKKKVRSQVVASSSWNEKMCPNGVEGMWGLADMNPYDNKGRCFQYQSVNVQLLGQHTAFFSFMGGPYPFAYVDFGMASVPMSSMNEVVLGKGAYPYITVLGSQKILHSFVVVQKSKERVAWDQIKADELAKEQEIILEERRKSREKAQLEQEKAENEAARTKDLEQKREEAVKAADQSRKDKALMAARIVEAARIAELPPKLNFKKNASFDHRAHDGIVCQKCHTGSPGKIPDFGKVFAHENCKGCHRDERRGPTGCKACHPTA